MSADLYLARRGRSTPSADRSAGRSLFLPISFLAIFGLVVASWYFITVPEGAGLGELFNAENWRLGKKFIGQLAGAGTEDPAFLDAESWRQALVLTYETLMMSILAIGLAAIGMLLTVVPASRTAADGSMTLTRHRFSKVTFYALRLLYLFTRAVPELIWAMIIIFFFSPGILPGAIALALHNFGILGKLCAEIIEDLDLRPARALRNSGASQAQILLYAIIPSVLPKFLTFILYRWEVIIRTTIIIGFVSAGGLGRQFRLSMSWFHYTDVALLLLCYLFLVFAVDLIAAIFRRMAH